MRLGFAIARIAVLAVERAIHASRVQYLRAKGDAGELTESGEAVLRALARLPVGSIRWAAGDPSERRTGDIPFEALEQVRAHLARLRLQGHPGGATVAPYDNLSPPGKRRC
jgi:hypothetical protein